MTSAATAPASMAMRAASLPERAVQEWSQALPAGTENYESDVRRFGAFWTQSAALLRTLPDKARRDEAEQGAADALLTVARASREAFLAAHVDEIYDRLTARRSIFRRLDDLAYDAAKLVPGLVPTRAEVDAEAAHLQRDKDGVEIDQGLFLAHVLSRPLIGEHLCHAMLLPRQESAGLAAEFASRGSLDLGAARLTRRGKAVHLDMINPRFLNAEDDTTLSHTELAVDVATLDRTTDIAVMRGVAVENEKYRGKRIFGAGINLTHLYLGKIPFLWFLIRDLGYVHKLLRGRRQAGQRARRRERPRDREAMDRRPRYFRHRRPLPGASGHGLRSRRLRRLHHLAGPQGRNHSRLRESPLAAVHRRSHRA